MRRLEFKSFNDSGLNYVNTKVSICSLMKMQIAYWRTKGRANIRTGRFAASISETGNGGDAARPQEGCVLTSGSFRRSLRKLIYPFRTTTFRIKYFALKINPKFRQFSLETLTLEVFW